MVAIITGNGTGLERSSAFVLGSRGQLGSSTLGRDGEGVYVNAATGNLFITREDEFLIGKGPDSGIGRAYNSLGNFSDENGDNWKPTATKCIWAANGVNVAGAIVTRRDWDGSETVFAYDVALAKYVSKEGEGAYDTIVYNGEWHWVDGESRIDEYYSAAEGYHIKYRTDTDGNRLTYTYTAGKLVNIATQNGESTYLVYSGNNLTELTTTHASGSLTRVRYAYDGSNRLATVTVDLSPNDSLVTDGNVYVTTYTYDGSSKRVASIAQADGSLVAFTYVLVGADYRVASYTQTVAAGVTRTTSFDYSVAGRTIVTDPAGQKTILFVDANKNLTQISYPPENTNTTPRVVQFAYNGNGDVTSATLGPGNVITYSYDGNGNLLIERDSAGNTVSRTYGAKNELLTETRYLVPDPDGAGSGQPGTPVTTRYAYDSENHLRYVVSAEGYVTQYEYDTPGQRTAANEYAGNAYNIAGLAENVSIAESTLTTFVSGLDKTTARRTETTYDGRGGVATVTSYSKLQSNGLFDTSSEKTQTTYVYDQAGKLLSRVLFGSAASEVFVYDGMGRMTQATDFNGNVTRTSFLDARGQTVLTHANGLSEVSTYNRGGELIAFSTSNAGGNLVDLTGWPGNPGSVPSGQAIVPGWANYSAFTDETQWASTMGPDGLQVVAIQSGQLDASLEGGGNYTNEMTIDASKAYEFTWQFKLSAMDKHYVFFGLSGAAPAYVENLSDGADNSNPYFWYAYPGMQDAYLDPDKWYKVVGYVLPQGTPTSSAPLGGVYDVATGQKVLDIYSNFRWNPERPGNTVHSRFFDYYGETNQQYSTYFYQPEMRQVSTATVLGPDAATSLYRYDNLGRLRMTVDPTGRRNYMMYDSVGRKVADIDADGSAIEYRYDGSDNLTSTTRYANKLSSGQIASLVDANGNPTGATFASLRPAAHADDQWTFQVYDAAQRLIQTIDGTGATTVFTYDGASRITSTKSFANRIDAGTIGTLKGLASNPNRWAMDANGLPLNRYNLSVAGAGTIDGANAYQITVGAGTDWQAMWTDGLTASPGQTVSATISVKAVGSVTMETFGNYGAVSGWGADPDAYATIVSGPGQLTYQYGGLFQVSGLSTTEATRITVTRTYRISEWGGSYFYLGSSAVVPGQSTIIAAPVSSSASSTPILPTADATNDRTTRSFYDNDGRLVATLDALGGLTQISYDKAGRKIRELGSATAANSSYWASGTLAQLIASVGTSASDRRTDYVYDARGFLRYTVDAAAHAVKFVTDAAGNVIRITAYNGSITPAASYSVDYIVSQLGAAGLDVSPTRRVTRAAYNSAGQKMFDIDAAGAVIAYAYDNVGNVIKQTRYVTAYSTIDDTPTLATMQSWAAGQAGNSANRISRNVYDMFGRVAYEVDAENFVTEHRYDRAGRLTKDIRYAGTYTVSDSVTKESLAALIGTPPGTEVTISYAYDADGLLSERTDGVGAITRFTYDSFGRVVDTIIAYNTAEATTTRRSYDLLGRVLTETRAYGTAVAAITAFAYDALGNLLTVTDPRTYVTTRTYDSLGRVLTVSVPVDSNGSNNLVTTNQYDAFGNVVKVSQSALPDSANSYRYFDSLGRLVLDVDTERFWTRTAYTVFGEIASVTRGYDRVASEPSVGAQPTTPTNAADAVTSFSYDKMGRTLTVTDAMGNTETNWYDAFGSRTQFANKAGGITVFTNDHLGRLTYEWVDTVAYNGSGTVLSNGFYNNVFTYDSRGNVIRKYDAYALGQQRQTDYTYDKANRLTWTTHDMVSAVGSDLVTLTNVYPQEQLVYNLRGELIQSVDAGGGKTLFYYDALGRKTTEVSAVGTLSVFTYDANGNVITTRIYGDAVSIPGSPGGTPPSPVNASNYRETSFAYDRANRLTSSTIANLRTGAFSGSNYTFTVGNVTGETVFSRYRVLREIDGNLNSSWTWFDKLGRKIAQVDREKYLTVWDLDTNGNAKSETRYATQIGATITEATTAASLPGLAGASAADRTTNFTYDKLGRRLTETRTGVFASSVSGTGALSSSTQSATVTYTYNPLGLVASKAEANGDVTNFGYDTSGRLMWTKGAAFVDSTAATVRTMTENFYDALGNVVRTEVNKEGGASGDDRVTSFTFGSGGRLATSTDATGFVRSFGYDAAGRVVKESYSRLKSDGTSVTEANGYRYDLAGRLITQAPATWNGSAWIFSDAMRIRYNTFGEVTGRGLTAGPNDTAVYQEVMDYDEGGRQWRSNADDGVLRFYVYDKAGNRTLTLASTGADLSSLTLSNYTGSITGSGDTSTSGAVTTIAVFDKRGQQLQTREPDRQLAAATTTEIIRSRAYNGFGEVTSETDARGYTTSFTYNTMGRLLSKVSPQVNFTAEHGGVSSANPTETYGYDLAGRLVSIDDANGNRITRLLLAGSGHGKAEALVTKEFHPDSGVAETKYDAFGDARTIINEVGSVETRSYDKLGRLTAAYHATRPAGSLGNPGGSAVQLIDYFAYDGLGQRIQHWNSQLTSSVKERIDYDVRGRVVSTIVFGGDTTTYAYAWDSSLVTTGLGTFGGWTKTTVNAASMTMTERQDYFGRTIDQIDYGSHNYDFTFDKGGRLAARTNGAGESIAISYYGTGLVSGQTGTQGVAGYEYDAAGNRTKETLTKSGVSYRNATAAYDAMGRMTSWSDTGVGGAIPASTAWEYDKAGNIRYVASNYRALDLQGNASGTNSTQTYWYLYDAMNRFTLTKGVLTGSRGSGTIEIGDTGSQIAYYFDGNRQSALYGAMVGGSRWAYMSGGPYGGWEIIPDGSGTDGTWTLVPFNFQGLRRETYFYTTDGYLAATYKADSWTDPGQQPGQYDQWGPEPIYYDPTGSGSALTSMTLDAMGRTVYYKEYGGLDGSFERSNIVYDNGGRVTSETSTSIRRDTVGGSWHTYVTYLTNTYGNGLLTQTLQDTYRNGSDSALPDSRQTFSYVWWDGALQGTIGNDNDNNGTVDWTTTFSYGSSGHVTSAAIADGRPRTVTFVTDQNGMIVERDEADNLSGGDPRNLRYFFSGLQLGQAGNNGTANMNYVASISSRLAPSSTTGGAFQGGSTTSTPFADFEQSYDAINGYSADSTGSGYTVGEGDTLQSIAQIVWGDSLLWYLIAQANGLSAGAALAAGQVLIIPNKVHNSHNNSTSWRVYDPNEAIGDTSPTAIKPPKKPGGCGIVGQIIATVIAVVISRLIPIPIIGPVIGNLASQAFLIAIGQQSKINWKSVGITAISAGLTPPGTGNILADVVNSTIANVATQGIAIATGLQKKFDWAGVAGAALGAGIGHVVGGAVGARPLSENGSLSNIAANLAVSGVSAMANAAARSLITGTSFGDNILAALPDVLGGTIGQLVAGRIAGGSAGLSAKEIIHQKEAAAAWIIAGKENEAAQIVAAKEREAARAVYLKVQDAAAVYQRPSEPGDMRRYFTFINDDVGASANVEAAAQAAEGPPPYSREQLDSFMSRLRASGRLQYMIPISDAPITPAEAYGLMRRVGFSRQGWVAKDTNDPNSIYWDLSWLEAYKARQAVNYATESQRHFYPISSENGQTSGNVVDAFRHAVWTAAMMRSMGEERARQIGDAHERDGNWVTRADYGENIMDLVNNNNTRNLFIVFPYMDPTQIARYALQLGLLKTSPYRIEDPPRGR